MKKTVGTGSALQVVAVSETLIRMIAIALSLLLRLFYSKRLLLRRVILRGVGVVARGSVGCSEVFGQFGVVVIRDRGVVGRGSIRNLVVFRCLSGVVLGNLGVVFQLFGDVVRGRVILRGSV